MTVRTDEVLKYGAASEEIAHATGVAVALNAGTDAALVYSARVMHAVNEHGAAV